MKNQELELKYSHNIIDHLGLKLYQNKPTNVIAELVSNSYDADAESVWVDTNYNNNAITILDNGIGMTLEEIQSKYLVIGKQKRNKDNLDQETTKGRKLMGRKGIGKLAPFGIAQKVSVITISAKENKINWFFIDLAKLLEKSEESEAEELARYNPEIVIDNEDFKSIDPNTLDGNQQSILKVITSKNVTSGTLIVLENLTLKKGISDERLTESMGRRFTVTLLKPDFKVSINNTIVSEENSLPKFAYRYPEKGYSKETISINGKDRKVKHWCGFVEKATWPQDQSGVGIYTHGKIAQDRPFVFGLKGREISTRYMYGVIEADWVDELPTEFISTDRTSINWDDSETEDLHDWGHDLVAKWVKSFQNDKKVDSEGVVFRKLNNPTLPKITNTEKNSIKEIVCGMSPKVTNDDELQNEVINKLTSAWLHSPSRTVIKNLWDRLKEVEGNHDAFIETLTDINEHLIPESLSLSVTTAQKIYALSKLYQLSLTGIEEELQVLLEQFPWIIDPKNNKYLANKTLKSLAKQATLDGNIGAHGNVQKELMKQPDEGTRPDFSFFSANNEKEIMVVELKSPQITLDHKHLNQLNTYINWLKDKFSGSEIKGLLIGSGASNITNTDSHVTVLNWMTLCVNSRMHYVELLSAMLKGTPEHLNDARVDDVVLFGGEEVKELLKRLGTSNLDFGSYIDSIEYDINLKSSKKGKNNDTESN